MLAVLAAVAALVVGVAGCGDSSSGDEGSSEDGAQHQIVGAGSTAQEVAQEHWVSEYFLGPPGETISYEPVGSFEGVRRFIAGDAAFAGSDVPLEGSDLDAAANRCKPGQLIEIPVYISAMEIAYNLRNSGLNLSPETVAKIFNGEIAKWDDPVIRRQNPSISPIGLPTDLSIVPVYRSGESGTTQAITEYLSKAAPGVWTDEAGPSWPLTNGEAAEGTKGAVETIFSREGNVGYIDSSQGSSLGVVSVGVGSGYVGPTEESAARAFQEASEDATLRRGPYTFPFVLDRNSGTPGAYPLTLVSYLIACTSYDSADEAAAIKGYLQYVISREGQEGASEDAHSAPLPASLAKKLRPAVEAIE